MALVKVAAKDWTWEINTGTDAAPTWSTIGGLTTFSLSTTKNDRDTTTFESDGWLEHMVASRGRSFDLEGYYLEDPDDGTRDAGQEAVETLAEKIGTDSLAGFQLTSPGGTVWTFSASADVQPTGGGNDDNTTWKATLMVSGQVTKTAAA